MRRVPAVGLVLSMLAVVALSAQPARATIVRFDTALGDFDVELFDTQTPQTVANFLRYVEAGDYTNTFFHRSVPGFVVQGGGFTYDGQPIDDPNHYPAIPQFAPVQNEPKISNTIGTIAMAKLGGDPNSATNQFFFNLGDNSSNLDNQNGGFTAFGRVLGTGLNVVNKIAALNTYDFANHQANSPNGGVPLQGYTTSDFDNSVLVQGSNLALVNSINVLGGKFTLAIASDYRLLPSPTSPAALKYSANKSALELAAARNTPYVLLVNNSATSTITSFSLQVADAAHFIDKYRTVYNDAGVTVTRADAVSGGEQTLVFTFAKPLSVGSAFTFQLDLGRTDGSEKLDDFRSVLFRSAGSADTTQNAKLTVNFSDGSTLVQTLANNASSTQSPDLFTFTGETDASTLVSAASVSDPSVTSSSSLLATPNTDSQSGESTIGGLPDLTGAGGTTLSSSLGGVATVPEPSSLVLASLGGMLGLLGLARRRTARLNA